MFDVDAKRKEYKPIVRTYMNDIQEKMIEEGEKHDITTLAICCVTDLLDEGAFVGGIIGRAKCSPKNEFEMLFQLARYLYMKLLEETSEDYAQIMWKVFSKQIIEKEENFHFSTGDLIAQLIGELGIYKKSKKAEDSDENNE